MKRNEGEGKGKERNGQEEMRSRGKEGKEEE